MGSKILKISLYGIYLLLLVVGLMHHEMWRDEYDWFIQARDTDDFLKLHETMSPGHGMIWRSCLWVITRFTHNPVSMQIFHGLIAASFAFLLFFKSPFKVWQSALLAGSYFFLFEYAVISRCYAFGVLFIFWFAYLYKQNGRFTFAASVLLFLFSNTSVYALLLTPVLLGWLVYRENFRSLNQSDSRSGNMIWKILLVLGGIALSAWQIMPHPDNSFPLHRVWLPFDDYRFEAALTQFFSAFVPICRFSDPHFWNTNFLMNADGIVTWEVVLPLFILVSLPFRNHVSVLVMWITGVLLILAFQYHTGFRFARYYGHLFLFWVICQWLVTGSDTTQQKRTLASRLIFSLILILQLAGGVSMYAADFVLPFSRGKEVAEFIRAKNLQDAFIIGTVDFSMSPISGELNRDLFYLEQMKPGSYTRWDKNRQNEFDSLDLVKALNTAPYNQPLVFICSYEVSQLSYFRALYDGRKPNPVFNFNRFRFRLHRYFEAGIEKHEGYWIFKVERMD